MPSATELLSVLIREMSPALIEAYKVGAERTRITKHESLAKEYIAGASVVNMAEALKVKVSKCPACAAKIDRGHNHVAPAPEKVLSIGEPMKRIGRATWNDFHTRAEYFPVDPSFEDQEKIRAHIVNSISSLPCASCVAHGLDYIRDNPVDASSRDALKAWVCRFHDEVNSKLGKQIHGCPEVPMRDLLSKAMDSNPHGQ